MFILKHPIALFSLSGTQIKTMNRTFYSLFFAALCSSIPLQASLLGTSVSGSLVFSGDPSNYFDPTNSFVPSSGYLNSAGGTTVTIQDPAIEFGAVFPTNTDSADFNASQLTITDLTTGSGVNFASTMSFTDTAFRGLTLSKTSDSFTGGVTGSLAGDIVTVSWARAGIVPGQTLKATFNLTGATTTPEPASWGMLAFSGVLGALVFLLRKQRARASMPRP